MGKGSCAPSPSPSPSPAAAICCMCGDHGVPQELFNCKICLVRSQHKYCSNIYPRATMYRACNWCLREEVVRPHAGDQQTIDHDHHKITSISASDNDGSASGASDRVTLQRGAFVSDLDKPIKKQRAPEKAEELSPRMERVKRGFRGKARRYKLLEDVTGK